MWGASQERAGQTARSPVTSTRGADMHAVVVGNPQPTETRR
jgi:hypothetical protein